MQKIKNFNYREFLDKGLITLLGEDDIKKALQNMKGKKTKGIILREARSLLILLYYTGARPNEILRLRAKDITKEGVYVHVLVPGSKKGLPRTIYLPYNKDLVKEVLSYAVGFMPDMLLFYHFQNKYVRTFKTRKGEIKQRTEISDRLRYHFKIWFTGILKDSISPYYLRHNRFSKLSEKGIDLQQLRMMKGSKTMESITPYLHMSSSTAKKISKKID